MPADDLRLVPTAKRELKVNEKKDAGGRRRENQMLTLPYTRRGQYTERHAMTGKLPKSSHTRHT